MRTESTSTVRSDWFDSLSEFVGHCETPPPDYAQRESITGSKSFTGTENYSEALDLFAKGWEDGARRALAIAEPIQRQLYSLVAMPQVRYDVTGELLDVGRYCAGEPEHWGVWHTELREGPGTKYVRVNVSCAASCMVGTETIIAKGAYVGAFVNLMELAGCRVEVVTSCTTVGHGGHTTHCYITVKQFDAPLDLERLVASLHPSMVRRLQFRHRELLPKEFSKDVAGPGYGRPDNCPAEERGDVYIGRMLGGESQWDSPSTTIDFIRRQLVDLGAIRPDQLA